MNVNCKSGHIDSFFHKRREGFAFTVEKYDFDNPEINQTVNII